jgi:homeobox domain-containing protein
MSFHFFLAKSLPLHCVVESVPSLQASFQLDSRSPWRRRPNIETDSYVIIPAATPFCDIVTIALQRLGYSSDISNTAKGKSLFTRCAMHLI